MHGDDTARCTLTSQWCSFSSCRSPRLCFGPLSMPSVLSFAARPSASPYPSARLALSAGNIMLTSESGDFTAKVADFGLSAAKQAASATSSASKSVFSGAGGGGVGGTIEYMAPELHSLESPTAAADIYGEYRALGSPSARSTITALLFLFLRLPQQSFFFLSSLPCRLFLLPSVRQPWASSCGRCVRRRCPIATCPTSATQPCRCLVSWYRASGPPWRPCPQTSQRR